MGGLLERRVDKNSDLLQRGAPWRGGIITKGGLLE